MQKADRQAWFRLEPEMEKGSSTNEYRVKGFYSISFKPQQLIILKDINV